MFACLAYSRLQLQLHACISDGSEGTESWPGCMLLKTQVVINVLFSKICLHLQLTSDDLRYGVYLASLGFCKWYNVISKWGFCGKCVCACSSLSAHGGFGMSQFITPHPCLHAFIPPQLRIHCSCTLFWGLSFGELNSNKVISHQSLFEKFSLKGSGGNTDHLSVPFLAEFSFSQEGTQKEKSHMGHD